jgi:2',3'-cyclic-nucleotide 2'-phosphodiesterase (5'-nucleotidase family)
MKIYFKLFLISALTLLFAACSHSDDENLISSQKSIVILYENDVHCNIQGYQKLAGLRDAIANSDTAYAGIVSCGDYLNGGVVGAASKGQYIVDIMRNMCYDAITIGNHEFDFGLQRMKELLKNVNAPVVCANLFDYGETTPFFAPYVVVDYLQNTLGGVVGNEYAKPQGRIILVDD